MSKQYGGVLGGLLEGLAETVMRRRLWFILAVTAIIVGFAAALPNLRFHNTPDSFFLEGDPTGEVYEDFKNIFESDEFSMVVIEAPAEPDTAFVDELRRLVDRLGQIEHVLDVTALTNVRHIEGTFDGIDVGDYIPRDLTDAEVAERFEAARDHPHYEGLYITADGAHLGILVETAAITGEAAYKTPLTEALRGTLAEEPYADWSPLIVGAPVLDSDVEQIVSAESALFGGLVFLVVAFGFLYIYRSFVGLLVPIGLAVIGIVVAFGFKAMMDMPTSLLTPIIPSFLISVGIGGAIFILTDLYTAVSGGHSVREAVLRAMRHAGPPAFMAALTTAATLLAFSTSHVAPVRHVGLTMGFGLFVVAVLTIIAVPLLFSFLTRIRPSDKRARLIDKRVAGLDRLCTFVCAHHRKLLAAFLVGAAICIAGIMRLETDYYYLGTFKEHTDIRQDYNAANEVLPVSNSIEVMIRSEELDLFLRPEALGALAELQEIADDFDGAPIKTYSLVDVLKEIREALYGDPDAYVLPETREEVAQSLLLFESSGHDELTTLTSPDYDVARLTILVPTLPYSVYEPLVDDLENQTAQIFADAGLGDELAAGEITVDVTGVVPLWMTISDYLTETQIRAFLLSIAVVTLMMVFMFRSLSLGIIMSALNASVVAAVLGIMGWLGIMLDPFTILVGAIAIGILDDDTIHFVSHVRMRMAGGDDARTAIRSAYGSAGQAMLYTTLVLVVAFGLYGLSNVASLAIFGFVVALTVVLGLIAEYLFTPAVVLMLSRTKLLRPTAVQPAAGE